jgi:heterodisulfide reductase subunit B
LRATADSTLFIEYIAGAKRVGLDTLDPNNKTYQSVITVSLVKRLNSTILDTINERLRIQYRMTPSVFEVSKVYYNDTLKIYKNTGFPECCYNRKIIYTFVKLLAFNVQHSNI